MNYIGIFNNMDWMEATPLGRAEWIKVVGLFMDKEMLADSIFNKIKNNYLSIKQKTFDLESKPKVIIGSNYKGIWYMPGGRSFKAQLLYDAGAKYYWSKDSSAGSLALCFENVVQVQSDVDIWLEVPFKTYDEITAVDIRYGVFKAYKET
jgi:iron complex transport system substrate-binding protein